MRIKVMIFQSMNGLAPQNLIELRIQNSTNPSDEHWSAATHLQIPKEIRQGDQRFLLFRCKIVDVRIDGKTIRIFI